MLELETFISLKPFDHKSLWRQGEPVWDALHNLKEYLEKYTPYEIKVDIPQGVFLENRERISIGTGTIIEPGAYIQGPCIIGKNCIIRHGAYLRGPVILGDHCHIGHATEVKGSILLNHSAATHFVYLGDSILGSHVNLGAGVKCANLRLDRSEVTVFSEGKKVQTGLRKFGSVIGDYVQIGCNAVLNPGTLIGRESFSYAQMNLSGTIPPQSQINRRGIQTIRPKILEKLLCELKPTTQK